MKTLNLSLIFLFVFTYCRGQDVIEDKTKKNEISIVISDIIDGALQVTYERAISEHFSWGIGVGYKSEHGLISLSGLDTEKIKTNEITYTGFKIIPEIRYYFRKDGVANMKGFYVGAYLKYSQYETDFDGRYINDALENYDIEFDAKIKVTSIGFMVGYKLPVSEKFSIDFLIAGPGTGFYGFTIDNKKDLPDEFYEDLNEALDKYHIFDYLDGDFRFSVAHRKSNFNLLTMRYGISLGYSF